MKTYDFTTESIEEKAAVFSFVNATIRYFRSKGKNDVADYLRDEFIDAYFEEDWIDEDDERPVFTIFEGGKK